MRQISLTLGWAAATIMAADTMKVAWTTDEPGESGAYGPDGPWQAISVRVGNFTKGFYNKDDPAATFGGAYAAMWPSGGGISILSTNQAGGNYTPSDSSTANITTRILNVSKSDPWASWVVQKGKSVGFGVFDNLSFKEAGGSGVETFRNTSLAAMDTWDYLLPDNSTYTANVGILGLGSVANTPQDWAYPGPSSILQSLKRQGKIGANGFGLHMGSVALNQPGSLILGGYEQNRALGPMVSLPINPVGFVTLLDVTLGTQVGASQFTNGDKDEGSIWQGLGTNQRGIERSRGNRSATMSISPSVPYIYLPLGTCEEAAKRLPVTWNTTLGLYTWNTNDPAYERIIRSPAYLGFLISGPLYNITIKVPFQLLNLTLESPLTSTPTPYFPCKPLDPTHGLWALGRAFLQAAFVGLDFEHNYIYLAQAPGPAMGESVVKAFTPYDGSFWPKKPETNPISEFETSWLPSWTVLEGEKQPDEQPDEKKPNGVGLRLGLSTGAIVGTVLAMVAVWCL